MQHGPSEADYPSHPFHPDLCVQLSTLPRGFSNLVIGGKLSTNMIRILSNFGKWCGSLAPDFCYPSVPRRVSLTNKGWHTVIPDRLPIFERILCIALLSLSDDLADVAVHNLWRGVSAMNLHTALIDLLSSGPAFSFDGRADLSTTDIPVNDEQIQAVVWATIVIACPADSHFHAAEKGQALLRDLITYVPCVRNWTLLERILKLFYWEHGCLNRWKTGWEVAMKLAKATDEVARQWTGKPSKRWKI